MKTYTVSYSVDCGDGHGYDVVERGVIGFSFGHNQKIIEFEYLLTDKNRVASEGFSVDGILVSFTVEEEN